MADIDDTSWFGKLPHQLCAILPHTHPGTSMHVMSYAKPSLMFVVQGLRRPGCEAGVRRCGCEAGMRRCGYDAGVRRCGYEAGVRRW